MSVADVVARLTAAGPADTSLRIRFDRLTDGEAAELVSLTRQGNTPEGFRLAAALSARELQKWEALVEKAAGLGAVGMHEARHTFASLMIAAGVNAKALSTYMGHSSVTITYDRYGHLMPGNEEEAAVLLDAYLAKARAAGD